MQNRESTLVLLVVLDGRFEERLSYVLVDNAAINADADAQARLELLDGRCIDLRDSFTKAYDALEEWLYWREMAGEAVRVQGSLRLPGAAMNCRVVTRVFTLSLLAEGIGREGGGDDLERMNTDMDVEKTAESLQQMAGLG